MIIRHGEVTIVTIEQKRLGSVLFDACRNQILPDYLKRTIGYWSSYAKFLGSLEGSFELKTFVKMLENASCRIIFAELLLHYRNIGTCEGEGLIHTFQGAVLPEILRILFSEDEEVFSEALSALGATFSYVC